MSLAEKKNQHERNKKKLTSSSEWRRQQQKKERVNKSNNIHNKCFKKKKIRYGNYEVLSKINKKKVLTQQLKKE